MARRRPIDWPGSALFSTGDVLESERVGELAAGCDVIVHLAGSAHDYMTDPSLLMRSFVEGTRVVARNAEGVGARLVLVSSVAVYGTSAEFVDEATDTRPDTPYGEAKLKCERAALSTHEATLVLRPTVIYGRYDRGNVARLIRTVSRFGPITVGPGGNRKSLLFAPHFAERIAGLIDSNVSTGTWCVADAHAPTQAQLVGALAAILGRRARPVQIPVIVAAAAARVADVLTGSQRWATTIDRLTRTSVVRGQALDQFLAYRETVEAERALTQAIGWVLGWPREGRNA
jgi:nucleoside-diphosphate-sugar epimerase